MYEFSFQASQLRIGFRGSTREDPRKPVHDASKMEIRMFACQGNSSNTCTEFRGVTRKLMQWGRFDVLRRSHIDVRSFGVCPFKLTSSHKDAKPSRPFRESNCANLHTWTVVCHPTFDYFFPSVFPFSGLSGVPENHVLPKDPETLDHRRDKTSIEILAMNLAVTFFRLDKTIHVNAFAQEILHRVLATTSRKVHTLNTTGTPPTKEHRGQYS